MVVSLFDLSCELNGFIPNLKSLKKKKMLNWIDSNLITILIKMYPVSGKFRDKKLQYIAKSSLFTLFEIIYKTLEYVHE